jgi:hypothetical protein
MTVSDNMTDVLVLAKSTDALRNKRRRTAWVWGGALVTILVALFFAACGAQGQVHATLRTGRCASPEVFIDKSDMALELRCAGVTRGRFPVTFGANPVGAKEREGDERTPEGTYTITSRVVSRRFHRFLGVSYPNADDLRRARTLGVTRPGGGIGIHGVDAQRAGLAAVWIWLARSTSLSRAWGPTDGCVAMTNADVEVLFSHVPVGTRVVITP